MEAIQMCKDNKIEIVVMNIDTPDGIKRVLAGEEMSEKILNIRQKYYKKYSQFLTQQQIQRVYEIERQMRKRFAQKGPRKGGNYAGKPKSGRFQGQPMQNK